MASSSSSYIDSLTEETNDLMISPKTNVRTFKKTHFLKPLVTSLDRSVCRPPPTISQASLASHKLKLNAWGNPGDDWKNRARTTADAQKNVWTKTGIYDSVVNSMFKIEQNNKLIIWLAERWCQQTNSFVFSWGKTTLTLEDVLMLGCFSVTGNSIADTSADEDGEEIHRQLNHASDELERSSLHKASQSAWMKKFKGQGTEIEHVACLVYWLSIFVFPSPVSGHVINKNVFLVAISLHKGNKIAFAPTVLAGLYADLGTLKEALRTDPPLILKRDKNGFFPFHFSSPLKLVQVWAWERFTSLKPVPKSIALQETIMARWDGLKKMAIEDILPTLDSPTTSFLLRPYITLSDALSHGLYRDREHWVSLDVDLDEELEVLIRCIRVSKLVSLKARYIKEYLPHTVAMQFGMDQDIPGFVD